MLRSLKKRLKSLLLWILNAGNVAKACICETDLVPCCFLLLSKLRHDQHTGSYTRDIFKK